MEQVKFFKAWVIGAVIIIVGCGIIGYIITFIAAFIAPEVIHYVTLLRMGDFEVQVEIPRLPVLTVALILNLTLSFFVFRWAVKRFILTQLPPHV